MNATLPQVTLEAGALPGLSVIHWDDESMVLSVSLLSEAPPVASMADQIDLNLGIRAPYGRVVIGDLDVLVDSEGRIVSMEIRTNPAAWSDEAIPASSDSFPTVSMRFPDDFDDNQIARYDVPVRLSQDRSRRVVRLRLGEGASSQWARLASDVIIGVTAQAYLSEVRLLNFAVSSV